MRAHTLAKHGEQEAAIVVVRGDTKEPFFGEPYAVARVRAAMFNATIRFYPDINPEFIYCDTTTTRASPLITHQ